MRILFKGYSLLLLLFLFLIFSAIGLLYNFFPIPITTAEDQRSYAQILSDEDPRAALLKLQIDISDGKEIGNDCHPLAHELGRLGFEKYGSYEKAAVFQQAVCNSGYIHGVLESRLAASTHISEDIQSLCTESFKSTYERWQCFHGIGHGLMYYTNNNLPLSLQYCLHLSNLETQRFCINGVYMENFVSDNKLHPSQFVNDTDPFYPCSEKSMPYTDLCFYYAPTRILRINHNNYVQVYNQCNQLVTNEIERDSCVSGVSGQATKDNYSNVSKVEPVCEQFEEKDRSQCIHAMVSMFVNMNGTVKGTKDLCNSLHEHNRKTCEDEILLKQIELNEQSLNF